MSCWGYPFHTNPQTHDRSVAFISHSFSHNQNVSEKFNKHLYKFSCGTIKIITIQHILRLLSPLSSRREAAWLPSRDDYNFVLNVVSQKYSILLNHKQQVNWILYARYKGNCVYTDINPSNLVWWNICLMSYASIYVLYINNTISVSHCDFREGGGTNLQALTLIL